MMGKGMWVVLVGVGLSGCTQTPAPVLSGYKGTAEVEREPHVALSSRKDSRNGEKSTSVNVKRWPYDAVGSLHPEVVEPAAGPVAEEKVSVSTQVGMGKDQQPKVEMIQYTVKPSDTAYSLAAKFDTSVKDILEHNQLKAPSDVRQGQALVIPSHSKPRASAWRQVKDMLSDASSPAQKVAAGERQTQDSEGGARVASLPSAKNAELMHDKKLAAVEPAAGRAPQKDGVVFIDHQVVSGETIYRISRSYDASVLDIMAANSFEQPQDLKAGTVVKVPVNQKVAVKNTSDDGVVVRGRSVNMASDSVTASSPSSRLSASEEVARTLASPEDQAPAEVAGTDSVSDTQVSLRDSSMEGADMPVEKVSPPVSQIAGQSSEDNSSEQLANKDNKTEPTDVVRAELKRGQIDPVAARAVGLVWPVKGKIIRRFGDEGNGVAYTGINIAVPVGTPVLAMDGGTVLYADEGLKTYGKLVLIRHESGMVSAYAHNGHLLVRKGEKVKKGQVIATSGASGNVDVPQLHFELRRHASALDPLRELPKL